MILLLDNYDSFVHNVARILVELGESVTTVRSDELSVAEALALAPARIVISPGPRTPTEAGISVELVQALEGRIPVLGICLGHQVVVVAYGGRVSVSREPAHGFARDVIHEGTGLFTGVPSPFSAGLYHSLSANAEGLPAELVAEAWTDSGELMALRHRVHPVWGVQFHPESILTPLGPRVLQNFLDLSGGAS